MTRVGETPAVPLANAGGKGEESGIPLLNESNNPFFTPMGCLSLFFGVHYCADKVQFCAVQLHCVSTFWLHVWFLNGQLKVWDSVNALIRRFFTIAVDNTASYRGL